MRQALQDKTPLKEQNSPKTASNENARSPSPRSSSQWAPENADKKQNVNKTRGWDWLVRWCSTRITNCLKDLQGNRTLKLGTSPHSADPDPLFQSNFPSTFRARVSIVCGEHPGTYNRESNMEEIGIAVQSQVSLVFFFLKSLQLYQVLSSLKGTIT